MKVCSELEGLLEAGTPPDLLLDLTSRDPASQEVKTVSLGLGLPSLATALGGPGDLRAWRELQQDQAQYLVQVRQPGDLLPFVVRDLATAANLTNAAVLYDQTFGKNCFLLCHRLKNK